MNTSDKLLVINPLTDVEIIKALASEPRMQMLALIREKPLNINEISDALNLPQSTVATHIEKLEEAGLLRIESAKAKKGSQKICSPAYSNILIKFPEDSTASSDTLSVEMPIGLFTDYHVSSPCGVCGMDHIIGFLDMSETFLSPERMSANLIWFTSGFLEYKFPNNAFYETKPIKKIELSGEFSAQTTEPGNLPDVTLTVNNVEVGTWHCPPAADDRRGKLTPRWWNQPSAQYGLLKTWTITDEGTFIDGDRLSDVKLSDLNIREHHSVKTRISVKESSGQTSGMIIFGKGFGDYPQDLILRISF